MLLGTKSTPFTNQQYFLSRYFRNVSADEPQDGTRGYSVFVREKDIRAMTADDFLGAKDADGAEIPASELQRMALFVARRCVITPYKNYKCFIQGFLVTKASKPSFCNTQMMFARYINDMNVKNNNGKRIYTANKTNKAKVKNLQSRLVKPFKAPLDADDSAVVTSFVIWFAQLLNLKHSPWYADGGSNIDQLESFLGLMDCLDVHERNVTYMKDKDRQGWRIRVGRSSTIWKAITEQVYNPDLGEFNDDDLIRPEDGDDDSGDDGDDAFGASDVYNLT